MTDIITKNPENGKAYKLVELYGFLVNFYGANKLQKTQNLAKLILEKCPEDRVALIIMHFIKHKTSVHDKLFFNLCDKLLESHPENFGAAAGLSFAVYYGDLYEDNLIKIHDHLKPRTYVEIGVETGKTLALAKPPTLAIGIDPVDAIMVEFKAETDFYSLTSDDFFKMHNLSALLKNRPLDLVFLDGLHLFEQTLRDFINIEKYSNPETVIMAHDCLPLTKFTAKRKRESLFWSGDPWKIIPCLKKYRPDLKVCTIPTQPTGLGLITNLDSRSTVLDDNWQAILDEYVDIEYEYDFDNRIAALNVIENDWDVIVKKLPSASSRA